MARKRRRKRALRTIAAPFTVAAPSGARIRERLRLPPEDEKVLREVGEHLGSHQRADQFQLSMRCLYDERAGLRRAIRTISKRIEVPCGQRKGKVRGYKDQSERWHKQRRLQGLRARLVAVEQRIKQGRPSIVAGGRSLAKVRHNLADARLTESEWHERWEAERMFLTADGESGAPYGNYTITVDPQTGSVSIVLPEPLRHLANAPRGRYKLACTTAFHHRRDEWLDRVHAHRAVRYDIVRDPIHGRWYLDASWSTDTAVLPTPGEIQAFGERTLGIDLNADHLAAYVLDSHGNPVGEPVTIPLGPTGPASQRDGTLRAAITELLTLAKQHHCAGTVIEDLGFDDARATGRETMGRGGRGKKFRRVVAGIPTARFREHLRGMAFHGVRRATGQAVSVPRPRGVASPPRTTGAPNGGDKTCWSRGDQLAVASIYENTD
ncbi:hypothetical protein [Streptomyces alanosinicus]|uniref:Transposase n=1 Tax=Streptomyces alanosinicus TaxID=68171 RepID=A0A918YDE4_9ACTN|nr:hypothetical protein [Streptomyces alanosinicus]GHD98744.1 transposase [Streptomyces alanosinicus]